MFYIQNTTPEILLFTTRTVTVKSWLLNAMTSKQVRLRKLLAVRRCCSTNAIADGKTLAFVNACEQLRDCLSWISHQASRPCWLMISTPTCRKPGRFRAPIHMAWTPDGDSIVYWSQGQFGVSTLPRVNRVKFRSRLMTRARPCR